MLSKVMFSLDFTISLKLRGYQRDYNTNPHEPTKKRLLWNCIGNDQNDPSLTQTNFLMQLKLKQILIIFRNIFQKYHFIKNQIDIKGKKYPFLSFLRSFISNVFNFSNFPELTIICSSLIITNNLLVQFDVSYIMVICKKKIPFSLYAIPIFLKSMLPIPPS